jgi:hypothetical protein
VPCEDPAVQATLALVLSDATKGAAGILFLSLVAVEWGGVFLYRVVRRRVEATPFQQAFFRAGHAHAGVLIILGLLAQLFADADDPDGLLELVARGGIPLAAILMPAGFFLSAWRPGATAPNRLVWLVYAGGVSLGLGALALGIALLT